MVGRPADKFCKENIEEVESKGRWRCKHCKEEFSGSASRIRNHLAGRGIDIRHCEAVPLTVREEALQRSSKKRGRASSSKEINNDGIDPANFRTEGATNFQIPSSNVELSTHTNKDDSDQECTTNVILKFFISQNLPIDVVEDPHFRTLLRRVSQHGVPSCILRNDSVDIQKSLWNCEHEVNKYMQMVMESWKTTGCTLICYNLNQGRINPSASKQESLVYGFYSPKGFIFVEGRHLDFSQGFRDAFEKHVLKLPTKDVTHQVFHSGHPRCEFSSEYHHYYYYEDGDDHVRPFYIHCVQQRVEELWMRISREIGWVRHLIHKSEKLYNYLLHSPKSGDCKGWRELVVEKDAEAMPMTSFIHLESIMLLKVEIKEWLSNDLKYNGDVKELGVVEIIDNNEFWCDGEELLDSLMPLMRIINDLDTLVPTASYLQLFLDSATSRLKRHYKREVSKYQLIWQSFYSLTLSLENDWRFAISSFLSPFYDWKEDEEEEDEFDNKEDEFDEEEEEEEKDEEEEEEEIEALQSIKRHPLLRYFNLVHPRILLMETEEDEIKKLDAEMEVFKENNSFANLDHKGRHPVELWNKYGAEFPLLKKCAIRVLSRPVSCMCNQVKKHINHFRGEDNFILRLNYHMMQTFTQLGDKIYKPLESRQDYYPLSEVPAYQLISPHKMTDGPHVGQIPAWMNQFISKSIDVIADGNCGYRAIAESLGFGQDQWHVVRRKLHRKLNSSSDLSRLFDRAKVSTISKALNYYGEGPAPPETWLDVTRMGFLVASTFEAIFVVMGPTICCTYLPLYVYPLEKAFSYLPEIAICHIPERSHFTSLSLTKNAPLPPVCDLYTNHGDIKAFTDFLKKRLDSYCALKALEDPLKVEMYTDQIPKWMNKYISKSTDVIGDGNCGYRAIAESLGFGQDKWLEVKQKLYNEFTSKLSLYEPTIVLGNADTISAALNYKEPAGSAPPETWLEVTDMGLLVASTFQAMFVVMGPSILCTYFPLYLPDGCKLSSVPEIAICLIPKPEPERSHFISISLKKNAPLPPVCSMWFSHHRTKGVDQILINRLTSYTMKKKLVNKYVGSASS